MFFITKRAGDGFGTEIFLMIFIGMFICVGLALILKSKLFTKIILTDNYIQVIKYHVLFSKNSNEIYNFINIKSFYLDINTSIEQDGDEQKNINLVCLDIFNKKKYLFYYFTTGSIEQDEFIVNVLNDYTNKIKNKATIS